MVHGRMHRVPNATALYGSWGYAVRVEFDDRLTPAAPVIVVAEAGLIIASCGISEAVLIESVTAVAPDLDLSSVRAAYETARLEVMADADPTTPIALAAVANVGAPVPPPPPLPAPPPHRIAYRFGDDTHPSLPPVRFTPAEVMGSGSVLAQGRQRLRHVPWRTSHTIWSVAALFLILFAYAALGPVGRAPFIGDQGNKPAPSQSTPATGRGRRAVGAAGTAVVPVAHAPAAPKPSATPTPSPSTSPAASAPPSPSASSQPPGAPSGPPPAATPTVPPTPSPSPSSEPAAPTTTVPPPPPPATDPPQAPIVLCDPVVTVNCG